MPAITEVNIPVRFMFTLLGPRNSDLDYHEIGRSISTLMSNTSFHKVAYKANERRELLSAINEFLDDSIVLPPGDWDGQALLPFGELKAKSEAIRKRKTKALEDKRRQIQSEEAAAKKGTWPCLPIYLRATRRCLRFLLLCFFFAAASSSSPFLAVNDPGAAFNEAARGFCC